MKTLNPTVKTKWEGKQPLFYVQIFTRDFRVLGFLNGTTNGLGNVYKASGFQTEQAAKDAFQKSRYLRGQILDNFTNHNS
mgnify:CR=1 FL=1